MHQTERARHASEVSNWNNRAEELKDKLRGAVTRGDDFAEQLARTKETLAATIDKAAYDLQQAAAFHQVGGRFLRVASVLEVAVIVYVCE